VRCVCCCITAFIAGNGVPGFSGLMIIYLVHIAPYLCIVARSDSPATSTNSLPEKNTADPQANTA
jgi:hypothetical protein